MSSLSLVGGRAEPGFETCFDAFRSNFEGDGELGAACAIYRNGQLVLDAWGGTARSTSASPWRPDTCVPVFSVTKGVAALGVLSQVQAGRLELDKPVADFWPEFGVFGKERVTVRQALAHQAGVPVVSGSVTIDDLKDPAWMSARLAAEPPLFPPAQAHLYHAVTIGWITSELVRRSAGVSMGQWLRETLGGPHGLNLVIGRREGELSSIAEVEVPDQYDTPELDPELIPARAIGLNGLITPRLSGLAKALNSPEMQAVELAGANGIADARSLAKLYSLTLDGVAGLPSPELIADASIPVSWGDQLGGLPGPSWGAGLMTPWAVQPMLGDGSFGHDGAGGGLAFGHAPSGVSFAYVRNRMGPPGIADPLVYKVVGALADRLGITIPIF
ncbi:MAG TPA: serine hydrolase domain-containing protein [Caulobacter sp.]|nr:serine hydrolase domain-containing protein [Caulobacter sp.]